jgi:hypothetical protein
LTVNFTKEEEEEEEEEEEDHIRSSMPDEETDSCPVVFIIFLILITGN